MRLAHVWLVGVGACAFAYTPPRDTAGPATLRLEGPASVSEPGKPFVVTAILESSAAVSGTLQLVGDPEGLAPTVPDSVRFSVSPGVPFRREYEIRSAPGAYRAHYALHGYASFDFKGQHLTAHPVLVVETKFPAGQRVVRVVDWVPVTVSRDSGIALGHLAANRFVVQVFGKSATVMSTGWQGSADGNRASLQLGQRVDRGGSRECLSIHPPWNEGQVGTALVEFPVSLPAAQKLRLTFANAVRDGAGDGVTFRVRVAAGNAPEGAFGEVAFERHSDSKVWLNGEADLSKWAGRTVRVQLESHPGPKNNTAFDQSYWAEPVLIAGQEPAAAVLGDARKLGTAGQIRLGRRGVLDGQVSLGKLEFDGFAVRVAGDALEDRRSVSGFVEWKDESAKGRVRIRHRFHRFDVLAELWGEGSSVRAHFWLENAPKPEPWNVTYLEDISLGKWSAKAQRLYQGVGNVMDHPAAFRLGFDGHRLATSFIGAEFENGASVVQAVDLPPTDMEFDPARDIWSLHGAHETTFTIIPAQNVWAGVSAWRSMRGLTPTASARKLAGRFVFDLWGGKFAESSAQLKRAAAYGLTDSVVVWHNWQRWGYDVRLPDIFPPNPQRGSEAELVELSRTARNAGMLFAPHDNYIDFYPDADGFTYNDISFKKDGTPVPAWFNKGAQAQSYRWRADRLMPYLERNLKLIRDSFAPSSFFIDVWSSVGPYDSWTRDGGFISRITTRDTWAKAFTWIRNYLGNDAPQISESGHDQLIGALDGAQANHLRVDTPPAGEMGWTVWNFRCKDSERIPWIDAAYHNVFILHGAGYENRYVGGLDTATHGMYSDDYMATEVMTGHPAMVKQPFGREVVRKYYLLSPIMKALSLRVVEGVEFAGGDMHRQHIRWSGGAEVWVNRGAAEWTVPGHTLPQYGFYARGGGVEAAVERAGSRTVEWSNAAGETYVNPRGGKLTMRGISTDGAIRVVTKGGETEITPLPESKALEVRLKRPLKQAIRIEESGARSAPQSLPIENGEAVLRLEAGAFKYYMR